jgi:CDP-glucose 4,6-dehydratase
VTGSSVLVTGATGLLGSHLVQAALARGARVVCLVRDWAPRARTVEEGWIDRAVLVRGELEDLGALVRTLNEHEIDTVLHAGAQTIVGTAARSPVSTFESNVRGTWNLLEACRALGSAVRRIVVLSSDKAYGVADRLPYTEETPLRGRNPYDASKAAADLVALSYFHTFGLPVAIARCANLYGPGDLNWSRLVPGTIRAALRGEPPVIRSDGRHLRDWFFAEDAAAAVLLLADRIGEPGIAGEALNFGTERTLPVLEVVRTILRMTERSHLEPVILDEARDEIRDQSLDCTKARERLGWRAAHELEDGLRKTIAWYRERRPDG